MFQQILFYNCSLGEGFRLISSVCLRFHLYASSVSTMLFTYETRGDLSEEFLQVVVCMRVIGPGSHRQQGQKSDNVISVCFHFSLHKQCQLLLMCHGKHLITSDYNDLIIEYDVLNKMFYISVIL